MRENAVLSSSNQHVDILKQVNMWACQFLALSLPAVLPLDPTPSTQMEFNTVKKEVFIIMFPKIGSSWRKWLQGGGLRYYIDIFVLKVRNQLGNKGRVSPDILMFSFVSRAAVLRIRPSANDFFYFVPSCIMNMEHCSTVWSVQTTEPNQNITPS